MRADDRPAANFITSLAAVPALPPRWGLSVVGSMPYVTNFNLQVAGATIDEGRAAASALRKELGVQVMALPYGDDGVVEVGCNLQATAAKPSQPTDAVLECACARASRPARASPTATSSACGPPRRSKRRRGNSIDAQPAG